MSSSFRRFVHLVLRDKRPHDEFSLRNIDTSRFFFPNPPPPPHALPASPTALPPVAVSFCPPYLPGSCRKMDFMLLGGEHNHKVLAAVAAGDGSGSLLYDPADETVRAMPAFATAKSRSAYLTVGGTDLYAMNQTHGGWGGYLESYPEQAGHDHGLEAPVFHKGGGGFRCRRLPPTPPCPCRRRHGVFDAVIRSYAAVVPGSGGGGESSGSGSGIWITKQGMGTYSLDTESGAWSKLGDWGLPFYGRGEYAPELGLWFGLSCSSRSRRRRSRRESRDLHDVDTDTLRAVDLRLGAARRRKPVVRAAWEHLAPPKEWGWSHASSHLMHLGSGDELRMAMHRSEVYILPVSISFWVL